MFNLNWICCCCCFLLLRPSYELMFQRLIKHTGDEHPDQKPLQEALKLVHDILLHLNCKEREALENDQREAALRELEVNSSNEWNKNKNAVLSVAYLSFNFAGCH